MPRHRRPSKQMVAVLAALSAGGREWRHGYDLMKETGLSSGTLYPLLIRLTDQQLVEAEWREPERPGRPARHTYRLSVTGMALARSVATTEVVSPAGAALA